MTAAAKPDPARTHWHRPTVDEATWWRCDRHHLEAITPQGGRVRISTSNIAHTLATLPAGWVIAP